jgi:hypothetical protein
LKLSFNSHSIREDVGRNQNASKIVPGAMIFSLLNGVLEFAMLLAVLFCLGDADIVLASPT